MTAKRINSASGQNKRIISMQNVARYEIVLIFIDCPFALSWARRLVSNSNSMKGLLFPFCSPHGRHVVNGLSPCRSSELTMRAVALRRRWANSYKYSVDGLSAFRDLDSPPPPIAGVQSRAFPPKTSDKLVLGTSFLYRSSLHFSHKAPTRRQKKPGFAPLFPSLSRVVIYKLN